MAEIVLRAQQRTLLGKKVGRLRREGLIPGNIFGAGLPSLAIQFDARSLREALIKAGTSTVVDVHLSTEGHDDGKQHPVLIEKISIDPVSAKILHVDFHQVDLNRPTRAAVSVVLVGESPAVKNLGGVLIQSLDTLEVEALPRNLPHEIRIDIDRLVGIDDHVTVADLKLPEGVTTDVAPEIIIAQVVASKLAEEVSAEEAETAAEVAAEAAAETEAASEAEGATGEAEATAS